MTEENQPATLNTVPLAELSADDQELARAAQLASAHAYAPYSGFAVGAAVRTGSHKIYTGANIENAAYAVVTCAEISAIAAANAAGDFEIEAIAVAGHKFAGAQDASQVVTPCGRCRQAINEAAEVSGNDIKVLSCNGSLTRIAVGKISELLPGAFGPRMLGLTEEWPKQRAKLHATVANLTAKAKK